MTTKYQRLMLAATSEEATLPGACWEWDGAKVSYGTNAWLFQTPRNKKVNVTITWRADHPFTLGKQWRYASCTIKNVG